MRDDYYGMAVFGLIAVLFLFLFPVIYSGYQMQDTAKVQANEYTEEFVDNVRASAYFTDRDYENYITKMGLLGSNFDIEMYHYSEVYSPETDESNNPTGRILRYETVHDRNDIADTLYSNLTEDISRYELKKGDRFEIVVTQRSQNAGARLSDLFTRGGFIPYSFRIGEQIDNYTD